MGILDLADHSEDEFSSGQRKSVWVDVALSQETDILLLDEPTTFLVITNQVYILDLHTDLNRNKGTIIVIVLHDINLSVRYADYIFDIQKGNLVEGGTPEEIITEELVKRVFDLESLVIKDPVPGSPFIVPKGRYYI